MKRRICKLVVAAIVGIGNTSCPTSAALAQSPPDAAQLKSGPVNPGFGDYWYQGKAELTSYKLEQARYGEVHAGHAVLIFVTEDFSKEKHVKLDRPGQAGDDKVNVLKLNLTKKFNTGIYPYSIMTSVFTPIQRHLFPQTMKVTTSSQEWCGHSFTQMNLDDDGYHVKLYSYFEREGDQTVTLDNTLLEDEVWSTIRLNPDDLPTGEIQMIPGTLFQRLRHVSWTVQDAVAERKPVAGNSDQMAYIITYPEYERRFTIHYDKVFPHGIQSWEDTYSAGRRGQATTKATVNKRIMLDYWSKNQAADVVWRKELGLE
ncbi:MAG: hypothetical protein VYA69_04675 [Gemmatimonadota bacterium]|nr:hypothetical protein [Gemmatimonadota bacterium]